MPILAEPEKQKHYEERYYRNGNGLARYGRMCETARRRGFDGPYNRLLRDDGGFP
jgi:hypothetical protein